MKQYWWLVPLFFLALVQGAFLPLSLVIFLLLILASFLPTRTSFWLAFWSGLFLDLALATRLGLSSLIFLGLVFLLKLYSARFDPDHPLVLAAFVFLGNGAWSVLVNGYFSWQSSLVLILLVLLFRLVIKKLGFVPARAGRLKL